MDHAAIVTFDPGADFSLGPAGQDGTVAIDQVVIMATRPCDSPTVGLKFGRSANSVCPRQQANENVGGRVCPGMAGRRSCAIGM